LRRAVCVFRVLNANEVDPVAVAGLLTVMLVFGVIAVTTDSQRTVPVPFVVRGTAAPPAVSATWKVSVAAFTTKYILLITIPVVLTIVAKLTRSPLDKPCAVFVTKSPVSVKVQAIGVVAGLPTPVHCIPTTTPVVFAAVIVVDPTVGEQVSETGVTAPQLLPILSTRPCVLAVPILSIILVSSVSDNLQPLTLWANLTPDIVALTSDGQELNIVLILVALAAFNKGTDASEVQPLNILVILVTSAVLNGGIDTSAKQPENI